MFSYDTDYTNHDKMIYHYLYNKTFTEKLASHEWFFINYLLKSEMKKDKEVAEMFVMFVVMFYPDYRWLCPNFDDMVAMVAIECSYHDMNFEKVFKKVEGEECTRQSMIFGSIVTDFLVRVCGYSLIGCSDQKNILTSQSDCDKRFEELLEYGFTLHRVARLVYKRTTEWQRLLFPYVKGTFSRLPVLPTRSIHVPFDEFIEDEYGNTHKIMQFQPVQQERDEDKK